MASISKARSALKQFEGFLRIEAMPKLENLEMTEPRTLDDIWAKNDYFPGSENGSWNAGVYFLLDAKDEIIYIGKASNNNAIGHRLNTYFKTDKSDKTKWLLSAHGEHKFKTPIYSVNPMAICVIVISDYEYAWIAPALEEYLIKRLAPIANTVGKENHKYG